MPDFVTVEIKGADELQKKLESLVDPKRIKKILHKALKEGSKPIEDAIKALIVPETGFLEDNISTRISIRKDSIAGSAFIGPRGKVYYPEIRHERGGFFKRTYKRAAATVARYLEFGTARMAARPFMTQGAETAKYQALDRVIEVLRELLLKEGL